MKSRFLPLVFSVIQIFLIITLWVLMDEYHWTQDFVVGPFFYSPILGLITGAISCSFFYKSLPKYKVFSYLAIMFLSAIIAPLIVIYGCILATII